MSRIPITLVTGFLGSGKTTLVAHLLTQPGLTGTLVIVNEFGEVGIDHDLLEASSDDTILLANGCLCCTIRGNLVDTLLDVRAQVAEGRLRDFDRVMVETSGVADPAPLLGFLLGSAPVMALYRLERVITVCDGLAGVTTLDRQPEATNQVLVADRLVISKSDITPADKLAALLHRLRQLNPTATQLTAVQGQLAADTLLRDLPGEHLASAVCGPGCGTDCQHAAAPSAHASRFHVTILTAVRPIPLPQIAPIDSAIRAHAGPLLLRLKGILPLADAKQEAVLQGALMVVHPPEMRPAQVHGPGRLVLITDGMPADALCAALEAFGLMRENEQHLGIAKPLAACIHDSAVL